MIRTGFVLGMLICGGQAALAQPQAGSAPAGNAAERSGLTFEANVGVGSLVISPDGGPSRTESGIAGLNLGIGGWLTHNVALTLRVAGLTYSEDGGSLTGGFLGGALQIWPHDHIWLGLGVGMGFAALELENAPDPDPETGIGADFRLGFTPFVSGAHSLNFSVEVNPSFLDGGTLTGIGLLIGYQYL